MSTRNETHVHDLSTFANFKDWSKAISDALAAFGWTQSSDTGQVVWTATVLTMTQVTVGATAVYSYSSFTGPAPRVGMSVIVTGFATGGNNVTGTLTAVSGGASGTVTMVLSTQVNETHAGSGTTTAQSTVPTSGNYVYEIWQPGDGLTTFYVRFDYGNSGGSSPQIKMQCSTTTNGAGTLSGSTTTQVLSAVIANSGATTFNCLFAGSTSWFTVMMWRDASAAFNCVFSVERSHDSTGADTSTYFTASGVGLVTNNYSQQSVVFGVGSAIRYIGPSATTSCPMWCCLVPSTTSGTLFNGNFAVSPAFPYVGYYDNPLLGTGMAASSEFTELSSVSVTLYGVSHVYVLSKNQNFIASANFAVLLRFE